MFRPCSLSLIAIGLALAPASSGCLGLRARDFRSVQSDTKQPLTSYQSDRPFNGKTQPISKPPKKATDSAAKVTLVFVGETIHSRSARSVAKAVEVSTEASPKSETVVLLGNVFTQFGPPSEQSCHQQSSDLDRYYKGKSIASRYLLRGHQDWNCDKLLGKNLFNGTSDKNYIVRIDDKGRSRIVSHCKYGQKTHCSIEPSNSNDAVELVILDTVPWYFATTLQKQTFQARSSIQSENQHMGHRIVDPSDTVANQLQQQQALIESLTRNPSHSEQYPPRILVSHIPLESAGLHGLGGRVPSATYLNFPQWIRNAVKEGYFVGIVSGHEFSHLYSEDLSHSTKRSAKAWLKYPVFQIIVGNSGRPIDRWGRVESYFPYRTSISMIPELSSDRSGFVKLSIEKGIIDIDFFEMGARRWYKHSFHLPLRREAHPTEAKSPSMLPCLRCDPVQGAADGDQWTSRNRFRE